MDEYDEDASNLLTVWYLPGTDGLGELWVKAATNGFAGESAAYFEISRLIDFASALAVYPLPSDNPPQIASGFWKQGTHELELDQEQVGIVVQPVGGKGQIGVRVHLSTPDWPDTRPESISEVFLEILTTYERLRHFADELAHVLHGELDVAKLGVEDFV